MSDSPLKDFSVYKCQGRPQQLLKTTGSSFDDKEWEERLADARKKLDPQEQAVFDLLLKEKTFAKVGKRLKLSQPRISQIWESIRGKLK